MALNFPASPVDGQIYYDSTSGNRYVYDATSTKWKYAANNDPYTGTSNTQILFNNQNAIDGNTGLTFSANTLWANTVNVTGYIYGNGAFLTGVASDLTPAFNKANDAYTVANAAFSKANDSIDLINGVRPVANGGYTVANAAFDKANAAVTISNTAPVSPSSGALWWDESNATMYVYYNDGDSSQWVPATPDGAVDWATVSNIYNITNTAFDVANAAFGSANNVAPQVAPAFNTANAAYTASNGVNTYVSATYSTLVQWGSSFGVANAAFAVANAAYTSSNNQAYYAGNNGDKGNATGLGDIFRVHSNTLSQNVTIYSGNNALAAGPITVTGSSTTLTIQTGARLAIV